MIHARVLCALQSLLHSGTANAALLRAAAQIGSSLASGALTWWWMHHYHRDIIVSIRQRYNAVVVKSYHYGLVLGIMLVNSLVGTSFLQIYYRVYFV
jgi:hypothetical protein